MWTTRRAILLTVFNCLMTLGPAMAQLGFVELRKEALLTDNTRCLNQRYTVSLPIFDLPQNGKIIAALNDSLYRMGASLLQETNPELHFDNKGWQADKIKIDGCEAGISGNEVRSVYYLVVYNENDFLSLFIRSDWQVEKQAMEERDVEIAEQQRITCFTIDLAHDRYVDAATFFEGSARASLLEKLRKAYQEEYGEEMTLAGDRLQFSGWLVAPDALMAEYTLLLPNETSEVRSVVLPATEIRPLLSTPYKTLFIDVDQE